MPKSPFTPTQPQIAEILSHVRYEIAKAFLLPRFNESDAHLAEAVYLSAMIHARQLFDFFERHEKRDDDVFCLDFGFQPAPIAVPELERLRFKKDMMHLTYKRLRHTEESKSKPWPIPRILVPLCERATAFLEHVLGNPPAGANRDELNEWKALLSLLRSAPIAMRPPSYVTTSDYQGTSNITL